ncbi:MAG: amidohydrolase family protein [Candidatus Bathyarchaeota archaeon]|nr:MAG: amidohydrolase family protein [Candidatus Bathyarchaeota archaeon]
MGDILIRDAFIATMDGSRRVYPRGSMYVDDGRIVEVGREVEAPWSPEYVIDGGHRLVLPGFVNVHSHLQQYFRGVYELIGDFYGVNLPLEGYRRPEDMEWLGLASCAEFIYGGCTTSMVIYTYPDGFASAVEEAGLRVVLGADIEEVDLERLRKGVYEYLPEKGEAAFKRAVKLHRDWHGRGGGLFTTVMAPKAADLAMPETYLKCSEFAGEHGLRMTTHLSQSWRECQQVERLYGKTPPRHLHDLSVLDDRLTGAHCTYATEADTRLIAESGMGILHCRGVRNPLVRWLDMGIPVGLGTDDYFHDVLQLLRENLAGQRARARAVGGAFGMLLGDRTRARPGFYELLELATRRGAEVLGLGGEVGSLEPGKRADFITVDMLNPFLTPTKDPLTSLVLYGSSGDISDVVVDGRLLKKDGSLVSFKMAEALVRAQGRVEEIIGRFFEDHPGQGERWRRMVPYME